MAKQIKSSEKAKPPVVDPVVQGSAPVDAPQTTKPAPEKAPVKVENRTFRKRPVQISAFQWFPELGAVGGVEFMESGPNLDKIPVVNTLEGVHSVKSGDWIITGVKGEKYPCDADIFAMTYEEAKEGELPDPTKLPEKSERNMTWLIVRFANGDSFKIAAKYLAQKMVSSLKDSKNPVTFEEAMRSPAALVKFSSEQVGWNELAMVALGHQPPAQTDRPLEWAQAFKTVEIEPEPKPEKPYVPPVSDLKTARQEDAAKKIGKRKESDDDPDTWEE